DAAAALRPDLSVAEVKRRQAALRPSRGARKELRRVAIIGLGQIGGSIGLALGARGDWHRTGYDRARATMVRAHAAGVIDQEAPRLAAACSGADLAVIAVPVDALPRTIAAAARALPRGAALLDTGGARVPVTPALARAASGGVRAVGGHPIAGNEGRG